MCMYIHVHVFSLSLSLAMYMIIISRNRYIKLFLSETRLNCVRCDSKGERSPLKFYFFIPFLRIFTKRKNDNTGDN